MNTNDLGVLFAYNGWANRRMLDAAAELSADEYDRDLGASFRSVRGTLLHIYLGECRWLRRWQDGTQLPDFPPDALPDVAALAAAWSDHEAEKATFVASLTDERLLERIDIRGKEFTLNELVQHVINHSTYHRGQVTLLLRLLGRTPPATDFGLFLAETR